jgi:hypothetical protein
MNNPSSNNERAPSALCGFRGATPEHMADPDGNDGANNAPCPPTETTGPSHVDAEVVETPHLRNYKLYFTL